jgi:transposase-like protein
MTEKKKKALAAKRPVGRPSLYRPEYCEQVIELGREGHSYTAIAALLDVDKQTMLGWRDAHEDFSAALTRAKQLEQLWWEEAGRRALYADKFQSVVWKTSMAARFRDDYTERKEMTGANGGPIQLQAVTLPIEDMEDDEVDQIEAVLTAALEKAKGNSE